MLLYMEMYQNHTRVPNKMTLTLSKHSHCVLYKRHLCLNAHSHISLARSNSIARPANHKEWLEKVHSQLIARALIICLISFIQKPQLNCRVITTLSPGDNLTSPSKLDQCNYYYIREESKHGILIKTQLRLFTILFNM